MEEGQGDGLASVVNKDGWAGGRLLGLASFCFLQQEGHKLTR